MSFTEYSIPPLAAAAAIIAAFPDLAAKSALQKGLPIPSVTLLECLKAAPTVGAIVGSQMALQGLLEKAFAGKSESKNITNVLASSAVVGMASAPVLAIFNGQTMGWGIVESLRKFTFKQGMAISVQEAAFVAGLSAVEPLSQAMAQRFGNEPVVEYSAAFIAGAAGSIAGHPANTALTRWQSGLQVESLRQSFWGAARKARAIGCFSIVYKLGKEILNDAFVLTP